MDPTKGGLEATQGEASGQEPAGARAPAAEALPAILTHPAIARRYLDLKPLGKGGMGAVYAARDQDLDRPVALKITSFESEQALTRFEREGQVLAQISHPNVLKIYSAEVVEKTPVLVFELVAGRTLKELILEAGRFPPARAVDVMVQVLDGLKAAHAEGIIHRDLKSENILITAEGQVKILDFGLARDVAVSEVLTRPGAIMGTPAYMSPEQAQGLPTAPATDIYSSGVILFELLTGTVPFKGEKAAEVLKHHLTTPPPPASSLAPAIPPGLDQVVACALAKDPGQRYARAQEMARALTDAAGPSPAPPAPARRKTSASRSIRVFAPAPDPPPARPVRGFLLGSLLLLALLGLGLSRRGPHRSAVSLPAVRALSVAPRSAGRARVSVDLSGRSPVPLRIRLEESASGVVSLQETDLTTSGVRSVSGFVTGHRYTMRVAAGDTVLPGDPVTYLHPRAILLNSLLQDGFPYACGEDYLWIKFATQDPEKLRIQVTARGSGRVIFERKNPEPGSSFIALVTGLSPVTPYILEVTAEDPGARVYFGRYEVMTKDKTFRKKVDHALEEVATGMPIFTEVFSGQLNEIQDRTALPRILGMIKNPTGLSSQGLNMMVRIVGTVGGPELLPELETVLSKVTTPDRRFNVAKGMARLQDPRAFDRVVGIYREALRHGESPDIIPNAALTFMGRDRCLAVLDEISSDTAHTSEREQFWVVFLAWAVTGPRIVAPLARLAGESPFPRVQELAITYLARLQADLALPELRKLLEGSKVKDPRVLSLLLGAIGVRGGAPDVGRLTPFLAPDFPEIVRGGALIGLALTETPEAIPAVLEQLGSTDPRMRTFAVWGAGHLKAAAALPALQDLARARTSTQGYLPISLALLGSSSVIPLITAIAGTPGAGQEAILERAGAYTALGIIQDPASVDLLARVAGSTASPYEKAHAIEGLGLLGTPRALELLRGQARSNRDILLGSQAMRMLALNGVPFEGDLRLDPEIAQPRNAGLFDRLIAINGMASRLVRKRRRYIVPSFVPFLRTGLHVTFGDSVASFVHGLWSYESRLDRLMDERGRTVAEEFGSPFELWAATGTNSIFVTRFLDKPRRRTGEGEVVLSPYRRPHALDGLGFLCAYLMLDE